MGELVASCNMHVTFFSQSAVVDMADLHMSNSPDLNQVGCLRSLVERRTGLPEMIGDLLICIFKMAAQREFGF
jgi:hypothetical protein